MTNKILKFVSQMAIVGLMGFLMTSCEKNELTDLPSQTVTEQSSATTRSTVTGFVQVFNNGAWVPFEGVTVFIDNCPGVSTSTNGNSGTNYSLPIPPACSGAGHPLCMEYATSTLDGVTPIDAIAVRRHVLGLTPFTSAREYLAADVDRDGKITLDDVEFINYALLELILEFPFDNYLFVNEEDYQILQEQVDNGNVIPYFLKTLGMLNCVAPTLNNRRGIKTGDVVETSEGPSCSIIEGDYDCDNVSSFEYCNDGTLIGNFTGPVHKVRVFEEGGVNPKYLCNSWNTNIPCSGTMSLPLDPNQSYFIQLICSEGDDPEYIHFP